MSAKRSLAAGLFLALAVSFLFPQSLTEIAKKERERRAKLKGKTAVVVTNADLAKMKKRPAVEVQPAPSEPPAESELAPETPPPAAGAQEPADMSAPSAEDVTPPDLRAVQEKWEKANEYVELLTLKMSALWQQYYGLVDAGPKEAVQRDIGETFIKLQQAQEDETLARLELERFLRQQKSESAPAIWIR